MIRKCAVVAALREAFPVEFGGMYSQEEINTLDASILPDVPIPPTVVESAPEPPPEPAKPAPEPPKTAAQPAAAQPKPAGGISQAQINLIQRLAREKQVPEHEYRNMLLPKASVKDLTSREASKLIEQLQVYVFVDLDGVEIDEEQGEIPF